MPDDVHGVLNEGAGDGSRKMSGMLKLVVNRLSLSIDPIEHGGLDGRTRQLSTGAGIECCSID